MKALFYFELRVSAGIIENLKTRDITLIPTIFRSTKMFKNVVKPIDILTHVLMSIYFGTKIPTFLNILVLLKIVGISVISLVLRFSIMPALTLNSK